MEERVESEKLARYRRLDELEEMYPLYTSEQTLGHEAVLLAQKQAAILGEMSMLSEDDDSYNLYNVLEKSLRNDSIFELADTRNQIRSINDYNEQYLERYMNSESAESHMGTIMRIAEQKAGRDLSWKEWLAEYASEAELLSFLQYHNHIIEQQQTDPDAYEHISEEKRMFMSAVEQLRAAGTLVKIEGSIPADEVELIVGDIFNMIMQERTGFYNIGVDEMYIQQGYEMGPRGRMKEYLHNVRHIAVHELVHAVLGESFKQFDTPIAARWINEAVTEALTIRIDELNGFKDTGLTYHAERNLLELLLSKSTNVDLGMKLAYRAFSGTLDDREAFLAYLDIVWDSSDVLEKVNQAIGLEEVRLAGSVRKVNSVIRVAAINVVHANLVTDPSKILLDYEDMIALLPGAAKE